MPGGSPDAADGSPTERMPFDSWVWQVFTPTEQANPLIGGPDAFQALLEAERAVWVPLIQSLGITLD